MTGFRVSEHRTWRNTDPRRPPPARIPDPEPPVGQEPPPFHHQLLTLPARAHNTLFGRLQNRRSIFLTIRFLLVLVAVLLILQGVSGSTPDFEVGDYTRVTEPTPVQAYLAPGSTHKYPIDVAVGESSAVSAFFTQQRAVIRLPSMDDDGKAYGLQIGVKQEKKNMDVALMVAQPAEGFRTVPAVTKQGDTTYFEAVRFAEAGEYGVLVRSVEGTGPARILVSVVQAPLEADTPFSLNWLPLLSGTALATVLAGPYLPGAAVPGNESVKRSGPGKPNPEVALTHGFAHLNPTRHGPQMQDGRGASAEEIASHKKRGWVIRIE